MTDIQKVTNVDSNLQDSSYRQADKQKRLDRVRAEGTAPKSFSDIYDGRLLGDLNRSSAVFTLKDVEEASLKLQEIVEDMDTVETDNVVIDYPAGEMIELSILAGKKSQG